MSGGSERDFCSTGAVSLGAYGTGCRGNGGQPWSVSRSNVGEDGASSAVGTTSKGFSSGS